MKNMLVFRILWIEEVEVYIYSSGKETLAFGHVVFSAWNGCIFFLHGIIITRIIIIIISHTYGVFAMLFDTSSKLWGWFSWSPMYRWGNGGMERGDWDRKRWSEEEVELRLNAWEHGHFTLISMCLPQSSSSGVSSGRPSSSLAPPHVVTWAFRTLYAQF